MSRGPGKWQRAILQAAEEQDTVFLDDLMPPPPDNGRVTFSQYLDERYAKWKAIERAARTLERRGLVVRGFKKIARGNFQGFKRKQFVRLA